MNDADTPPLPIVGSTLSQVTVGMGTYLILKFWGTPEYVLEVEGPSSVTSRPGQPAVELDSRASEFGAVLKLLGEQVVHATTTKLGGLRMDFANGGAFTVVAPDGYETWRLYDDEGAYLLVTHAGGGTVAFDGTSSDI